MDLFALINNNQGVIMLGLLGLAVESRIHLRYVFRRLDKLEED